MRRTTRAVAGLALLTGLAHAQAPAFRGELLLEPGLDNGKCLTAASNANGATVALQPCTGAAAQKWVFEAGSVKVFGNKCLDVPSGLDADGTKLQIWTCTANNPNQQWVWTWDNHLAWAKHSKCMDVPAGNTANGTPIHIWGCSGSPNQTWNTGYLPSALPHKSQDGQTGVNDCGTGSSQTSGCQTVWINSADDFCLWAPPSPGTVGDTEREAVAYCTKSGRGARVIPDGTLKGVHFVKTHNYVQVTGVGNFTNINILAGDSGGEMDAHGADGRGNPIGGLIYGNSFSKGLQYHEWTSFMSDGQFCFRACIGPDARTNCQHIYDVMGCNWNIPANYEPGVFEDCDGDNDLPMGIYGTSTWYQGVSPTPPAHPAASSSNCHALPTVSVSPAKQRRGNGGFERIHVPAFAGATPAPMPTPL